VIDEHETDDEVMVRLAGLLERLDPVPAEVLVAAVASGAWRNVDDELAELVRDSALESDELAGVRGGGPRVLTFTSDALTVELEVLAGGRGIVGQVAGAHPFRIELRRPDGSRTVEADRVGRFSAREVAPGPISLQLTDEANGAVTRTEWIVI
jgi:hypothetical protein